MSITFDLLRSVSGQVWNSHIQYFPGQAYFTAIMLTLLDTNEKDYSSSTLLHHMCQSQVLEGHNPAQMSASLFKHTEFNS